MLTRLPQTQAQGIFLRTEDNLHFELQWDISEPNTYHIAPKKESNFMPNMKPHTVQAIVLNSHGPYFVYHFSASLTILTCADAIEIDRKKAP